MVLHHQLGWDPRFIDRNAWLWPIAEAAAALPASQDWPSHADLDAMYARCIAGQGQPALRFRAITPPSHRRRRSAPPPAPEQRYDGSITVEHTVPTRGNNWHDLLNALCFATWPRSKRALHARQYRALLARGGQPSPTRTREQDALTLFDEGGLIIAALPDAVRVLHAAIASRDGQNERSALPACHAALREQSARGAVVLVPFGHALLEHWVEGIPCPGAAARVVEVEAFPVSSQRLLRILDRQLSVQLSDPEQFRSPHEGMHVQLHDLPLSRPWA